MRPDPYGHISGRIDHINARLNETRDRLHEEIRRAIAEQAESQPEHILQCSWRDAILPRS